MIVPPRPKLSSRFGPFGGVVKRIVERLIRFAIVQQDEVNRNVDARLRDLEAAPVERRGADFDQRAQYAALAARLTFAQREIGSLRKSVDALRAAAAVPAANADAAEESDAGAGAPR